MRRSRMNIASRQWLIPIVAAVTVLGVIAVIWQLRPGRGVDDAGFAGGDTGQVAPPSGGGSSGDPGEEPGKEPVDPPHGDPSETPPPDTDRRSIAVDSYYRHDGRHLSLNYTNGVPACYGRAKTPEVEERADAVVVRIPRTPVKPDPDRACIEIALMGSIDVVLDEPLGRRAVLDAARDGYEVPEAASPYESDQAK